MKKKGILIFSILAIVIAAIFAFAPQLFATSTIVQGIYTDEDGVRWEWQYDSSSSHSPISFAMFDKPDSVTKVTVPSVTKLADESGNYFTEYDRCGQVVEIFDIDGETANESTTTITEIDLSNVNTIYSVSSMLDTEQETKIILPETTIYIKEGAFKDTKIDIYNLENASIGTSAFENTIFTDPNITITSNGNITGDRAFYGSNIETVYLEEAFRNSYTFAECKNLRKAEIIRYSNIPILGAYSFYNDENLEELTLQDIYVVSDYAFYNCTSLDFDISQSIISSICDYAFTNSGIQSFEVNSSLSYIGAHAFEGSAVKTVKLSSKVTYLGDYAFYKCPNLTSVDLDTFNGTSQGRTGGWSFASNPELVSVKLGALAQTASFMFQECPKLTGDGIDFGLCTSLAYRTFYKDTGITDLKLGDSIVSVQTEVFSDCNISNLDLNKVQELKAGAFTNNQLTELYLPSTLVSLKEGKVFSNNPDLKKVTVAYDTMSSGITYNYGTGTYEEGKPYGCDLSSLLGDNSNNIEELIVEAPYKEGEDTDTVSKQKIQTFTDTIDRPQITFKVKVPSEYYSDYTSNDGVHRSQLEDSTLNDYFYELNNYDELKENVSMYMEAVAVNEDGEETTIQTTVGNYDANYPYRFMGLKAGGDDTSPTVYNRYSFTTNSNSAMLGWMNPNRTYSKISYQDGEYDTTITNYKTWINSGYSIQADSVYLYVTIDNLYKYQEANQNVLLNCSNSVKKLTEEDISSSKDGTFKFNIKAATTTLTSPYTIDFSNLGADVTGKTVYNASTNEVIELTDNKYEYSSKLDFYISFDTEAELLEFENQVNTNNGYVELQGTGYTNGVSVTREHYSAFSPTSTAISYDANSSLGKAESYDNVIRPLYFYGLTSLKKLTIGEGYEFIGAWAFDGYARGTSLEEVNLPSTLKGIGSYAFIDALKEGNSPTINLPESLEYIGQQAFFKDTGLTEYIDLPNLIYIGQQAFMDSKITGIKYDSKLTGIGGQSAYRCTNLNEVIFDCDYYSMHTNATQMSSDAATFINEFGKNGYSDVGYFDKIIFTENVKTLPAGVNSVYKPYFYSVKANTIDISECGWTRLGYNCFQEANVETLLLPESLEKIDSNALMYTTVTNQMTLPDSITEIGDCAFLCAKLSVEQLPSNLVKIGTAAFGGVKICNNPVIPNTVTSIGQAAFASTVYSFSYNNQPVTADYETLTFDCEIPASNSYGSVQSMRDLLWGTTVEKLIFTENVTRLPQQTIGRTGGTYIEFYGLDIKEVQFDGLEVLQSRAFLGNTSIQKVDFSNDTALTKIDELAFLNCTNLQEVDFSNDTALTTIGMQAFQGCTNLQKVDFSNDTALTEIDELAFYGATSLQNVTLPTNTENTITLGYSAFRKTGLRTIGGEGSDLDLTKCNVEIEEGFTFGENENLSEVFIPNGFNNNVVAPFIFWNCTNLEKATIDYNVESIEAYAFSGDSKLDKIILWGNTEVKDGNAEEFTNNGMDGINLEHNYSTIKGTSSINVTFINETGNDTVSINVENSASDDETIEVTSSTSKTYTLDSSELKFTTDESHWLYVERVRSGLGSSAYGTSYKVHVVNYNPSGFTIPSDTDIYTYDEYNGEAYDIAHESDRRNETYDINGEFKALDEVLYLTSTQPTINIQAGAEDFDKSGLVVYGLRRDGIIVESEDFATLTNYYPREVSDESKGVSTVSFDDKITDENRQEIIDTIVPLDELQTSTTNFASLKTDYDSTDLTTGNREVNVFYTDTPTQNELSTPITINVNGIKQPRKVRIEGRLAYTNNTPIADKILELSTEEDVEDTSTPTITVTPVMTLVQETRTNANGEYRFDDVEAGDYTLEVKDEVVNEETAETERVTLASCEIHINETDEVSSQDNIGVTDSGEYDMITGINKDVFTISGLIGLTYHTVRFVYDDEAGNEIEISSSQVLEGTAAEEPDAPEREGYEFENWDPADFSNVQEDMTIKAVYAKKKYKVKFQDYDGTPFGTVQDVEHGNSAIAPEDPVREGYTFAGWDKDFSVITSNLTVSATYQEIVEEIPKYTVIFIDWDGSVIDQQIIIPGESVTAPEDPVREGHTFTGWDKDFSVITSDLTVQAEYEKNTYLVVFKDYDEEILKEEQVKYLESATPPEEPSRTGYDFTGWSEDYTEIKSDIDIIAEYEKQTFTVTFQDYDGTVLQTSQVGYEEDATPPATPVREGYTFRSWSTKYTKVKADLVVTAQYNKNPITISTTGGEVVNRIVSDETTANKVLAYCGGGISIIILIVLAVVNIIRAKIRYDKNK